MLNKRKARICKLFCLLHKFIYIYRLKNFLEERLWAAVFPIDCKSDKPLYSALRAHTGKTFEELFLNDSCEPELAFFVFRLFLLHARVRFYLTNNLK